MRKLLIVLIILMLSFNFSGCDSKRNDDLNNKNQNIDDNLNNEDDNIDDDLNNENDNLDDKNEEDKENYLEEITYADFKIKYKEKTTYMFFFGRPTCGACAAFKPIITEFANSKKIVIYFIDITNMTNEEFSEMNTIASFNYIPNVIITNNMKILFNESKVFSKEELKKLIDKYEVK